MRSCCISLLQLVLALAELLGALELLVESPGADAQPLRQLLVGGALRAAPRSSA